MNTLTVLIGSVILLGCGYKFYGQWLAHHFDMENSGELTPAHKYQDGLDYMPAKSHILFGHHFSSIAGAGAITGPILAACFGWLPAVFWIILGGIFFGGPQDMGALAASIRYKGHSLGEILSVRVSPRTKILFFCFACCALLLLMASLISIIADTFAATYTSSGAINMAASNTGASLATISVFITASAIILGIIDKRFQPTRISAALIGILFIILSIILGMKFHSLYLSHTTWIVLLMTYIAITSVTPVNLLLQPRDYLCSFLLYTVLLIAGLGILITHPEINPSVLPAFSGFTVNTANGVQYLFPVLFTTIACGAISGFHALIASGTTAKQLDKKIDAKPVAYGGMLLESLLAIVTICIISCAMTTGHTKNITDIFAGGIAVMVSSIPYLAAYQTVIYTILALTYSTLCLTSLDTCTRLTRLLIQEIAVTCENSQYQIPKFFKNLMTSSYFSNIIVVILAGMLSAIGFQKIWSLLGASSQLLSCLCLLAICSWLMNIGKTIKALLIPMLFMSTVTLAALLLTIITQVSVIMTAASSWEAYAQVGISSLLMAVAVTVGIDGIKALCGSIPQKK
ncbi:MAG: carbon starvation protein A [Anaerovibrio sp.]|uniref:carbon starvation CstA family protein n=1 Tax=Anaerovibrio sp. TaxID=1872532 RepID=UPI0025F63A8B|nr:carbon starvation CstA family protein [Anaerovibrio sp.]MCR5176478.1 carbon starvation protein A [Anaerovibrio sp.]